MIKGHTGYSGCGKCFVEGVYCDHRVVFLDKNARLRDNGSFRAQDDEDHHQGVSILEELDIDLVRDVPLDPMHLLYLGVMKKLLLLWLKGPLFARLSRFQFETVSKRLESYSKWYPREFARKSWSLKFLARWKATEYRQFLHYSGAVVLKGILTPRAYSNFLVLHYAVRLLSVRAWCVSLNTYADKLLRFFFDEFVTIYSGKFASYNVHNLIHLAADVLVWGPLESFSAFPFENYLFTIKCLLRKCHKPLQQIVKRLRELSRALLILKRRKTNQVCFSAEHFAGPLLPNISGKQYKTLKMSSWHLSINNRCDSCVYLNDGSIVIIENFVVDQMNGNSIIGRRYAHLRDLYEYPKPSSSINIYEVECLSLLQKWPVCEIKCKALRLPLYIEDCDDDGDVFAVFPLMMQEY